MIAELIRGHPLGVFFIVCLLLVIVETGLLLTALIVNTIVKYCQLERLPAVQLEDPGSTVFQESSSPRSLFWRCCRFCIQEFGNSRLRSPFASAKPTSGE